MIHEQEPGHCFAYMDAEDHVRYGTEQDCFIYIAVNAHWEAHDFELPVVPEEFIWRLAFASAGISTDAGQEQPLDHPVLPRGACSAAVLIARRKADMILTKH